VLFNLEKVEYLIGQQIHNLKTERDNNEFEVIYNTNIILYLIVFVRRRRVATYHRWRSSGITKH
jgi:hypothetical protein